MKSNYIQPDFKGQTFYIGLDIHSKSWAVCIRIQRIVAERFTMNPSPEELRSHLHKKYPGGRYKSVYEAGFCGFWIHRRLSDCNKINTSIKFFSFLRIDCVDAAIRIKSVYAAKLNGLRQTRTERGVK